MSPDPAGDVSPSPCGTLTKVTTGEETEMSAQPIHTQTEPTPRERLLAAVAEVDRAMLRGRVTRAAQSAFAKRHQR